MTAESVLGSLLVSLCSLDASGSALLESPGLTSGHCVRGIESSLGEVHVPRFTSNNTAISESDGDNAVATGLTEFETMRSMIRAGGAKGVTTLESPQQTTADEAAKKLWVEELRGSADAGFQLALRAGPICEEPVRNVMVILEGVEIAVVKSRSGSTYQPAKPMSGGMVVAALRSGIRCGLLTRPVRLTEGHLRLTLHSSLAGLGALYNVLSKRRGKVLDDSMVDGTDLLMITAQIPQAEAFGLAPELFGKTSGEVTAPEMIFSHWERLDADPFWIPTSLEEREDFGEVQLSGDSSTGMDNTALRYIRKVRERKGLVVDSTRTVTGADKQRTLKR
jgi:ribosome assembly protein 1